MDLGDVLIVAGLAVVTAGVAWLHIPVGVIVGGVALLLLGIVRGRSKKPWAG